LSYFRSKSRVIIEGRRRKVIQKVGLEARNGEYQEASKRNGNGKYGKTERYEGKRRHKKTVKKSVSNTFTQNMLFYIFSDLHSWGINPSTYTSNEILMMKKIF
jgi:hypothetical protein